MNKKTFYFSALLALLALGCSSSPSFVENYSSPYHETLEKFSQKKRFFGIEQVEYQTMAVYKTPELRRAYVEEYAKRYNLPNDRKNEMLERELNEAKTYDVFMIAHYATNAEAAKLTKEAKAWRLTLSDNADPTSGSEPVSVEQLPTSRDPVLTYFYPFITAWSANYQVKFSKLSTSPLHLRMMGVKADLDFVWTQ